MKKYKFNLIFYFVFIFFLVVFTRFSNGKKQISGIKYVQAKEKNIFLSKTRDYVKNVNVGKIEILNEYLESDSIPTFPMDKLKFNFKYDQKD